MSDSTIKVFTRKLTDWLIAFCIAGIFLWFLITQPVVKQNDISPVALVDIENLKKHVQLLTVGYAPRTINYDNLNDTAAYIFRQFQYIGNPKYQYLHRLAKEYRNVVLQLGPDTQEVYVIGAHYDAENDSIDTEGNASGVAALIELARQISKNSKQLDTGIIFVAYPLSLNQASDVTKTGSFLHARSLRAENKRVHLMISLDSVGQFNSATGSQSHPYSFMKVLYPNKGNYVNIMGRVQDFNAIRELKQGFLDASELPLYSQSLPEHFSKGLEGDHLSYWRNGYPAVLMSDTKKYREKNSPTRNPMQQLDFKKMAMLVNGLTQAILQNTTSEKNKAQIVQRSRNNRFKEITVH